LPLDGNERARLRHGRLQCAKCSRHHEHLIVAHAVTNVGTDRSQLATMAQAAKAALCSDNLDVVADGAILKVRKSWHADRPASAVTLPKPQTSGAKSAGRFGKPDFVYLAKDDVIAARPARSWRTTSPLMTMARKCGFT